MEGIDHVGDRNLVLVGKAASVQVWHDAEARWLYVRWRGPYEPRRKAGPCCYNACTSNHARRCSTMPGLLPPGRGTSTG